MLKVKWITWDDETEVAKEIVGLTADIAGVGDMQLMTRPWPADAQFTEVGVFTERMDLAKRLAATFAGRIRIVSPKGA